MEDGHNPQGLAVECRNELEFPVCPLSVGLLADLSYASRADVFCDKRDMPCATGLPTLAQLDVLDSCCRPGVIGGPCVVWHSRWERQG